MASQRTRRIVSSLTRSELPDRVRRKWFVGSLALYGGATGAAALIVTILARSAAASYPAPPEHFSIWAYLVLSMGGIGIGATISGLLAYLIGQGTKRPRSIFLWLVLGFGFGILLPVLTGFTVPTTTVLLQIANSDTLPSGPLQAIVDAVFQGIPFAFVYGTLGIFTGMLAGTLLGLGAWVIDMANSSDSTYISRYGSLVASITLSVAVVGLAAFGPASFLAKLG